MSTYREPLKLGDRVQSRATNTRGEIVAIVGRGVGRACGVRVDGKIRTTAWIEEELLEKESPVETLIRCLNAD